MLRNGYQSDRLELGALHELQLVVIAPPGSGLPVPRVTPGGDAVLQVFARAL